MIVSAYEACKVNNQNAENNAKEPVICQLICISLRAEESSESYCNGMTVIQTAKMN